MKYLVLSAALSALAFAAVAGCSTDGGSKPMQPSGAWQLNNPASELRFVTTKNTNFAEVQQFKRMTGQLSANGTIKLVIDLASVETQVPLRNERMQAMLFEVARFPSAAFEGQADMGPIGNLAVGASVDVDVAGQLSIRGQSKPANASLRVVKLRGDQLLVTTRAPILVSADQFDLTAGVEKLREIMGLPNIVGTVPVSFALVFQP